jgi:hypothetical protein
MYRNSIWRWLAARNDKKSKALHEKFSWRRPAALGGYLPPTWADADACGAVALCCILLVVYTVM